MDEFLISPPYPDDLRSLHYAKRRRRLPPCPSQVDVCMFMYVSFLGCQPSSGSVPRFAASSRYPTGSVWFLVVDGQAFDDVLMLVLCSRWSSRRLMPTQCSLARQALKGFFFSSGSRAKLMRFFLGGKFFPPQPAGEGVLRFFLRRRFYEFGHPWSD